MDFTHFYVIYLIIYATTPLRHGRRLYSLQAFGTRLKADRKKSVIGSSERRIFYRIAGRVNFTRDRCRRSGQRANIYASLLLNINCDIFLNFLTKVSRFSVQLRCTEICNLSINVASDVTERPCAVRKIDT